MQIDESDMSDSLIGSGDSSAEAAADDGGDEEVADEKEEAPAKAEDPDPEVFYYPSSIAKEAVIEYVGMYWLVGLNKDNKWPAETLEGTPQVSGLWRRRRRTRERKCQAQPERDACVKGNCREQALT